MQQYKEFRPTQFDTPGLNLEDRQDWLVAPVGHNRDSDVLTESNWETVLKDLEEQDRDEDVEVHRFGHWGPGWFEIILVRPGSPAAKCAEQWEAALADYPVADDEDFSRREYEEAQETWSFCYNDKERIKYIRKNREQFEFNSLTEMMQCVRGEMFRGYASELLH